ncbi:MAG: nuclear transport factor 2 family protein [Burkholderiaceae bacterium]
MNDVSFKSLLERFTEAVQAGDGDALAACFSEQGTYHDYIFGPFTGRAAISTMLTEHFFEGGRAFRWEMLDPVSNGRHGYAHYVFSFTSTLPGAEGRRVAVDGMAHFELDAQGLILAYREVVNGGLAMRQLGHAPQRMARIFDRWNERLLTDPRIAAHKSIVA